MSDTQLTPDDAKRLLSCMQLGILIQNADGHRWLSVEGVPDDEARDPESFGIADTPPPLNELLRKADKEPLRCKQYGSLRNCLDVIDGALHELEFPALRELYDVGGDFMWGFER